MSEQILVTRSSMPSLDEYIEEIKDIWETHWLTNMGAKHKEFQTGLLSYLETDNIELFTNGHMALELVIQAMNLPKGGEVITTPFTFASTTHAIVRNGLVPVFCDINDKDYTIDVSKFEELITDKTCAIVPVHVYGNVCDIEAIDEIAKKYNLKVIYDAAHTFGEKYKGVGIANFGDASCFSFHATKVFNSIEGGAACYKDKELGSILYDLKNFGIHGPEEVGSVGANAKMNEFCAAMGICNLRHLDEEIAKRKLVYERYVQRLSNVSGITINSIQPDVEPNYAYFPIIVDESVYGMDRNQLCAELEKQGIYARKYFYPLVNDFDCYKADYSSEDTPVAKWVSDRVITLPMYADISSDTIDLICDIIQNS